MWRIPCDLGDFFEVKEPVVALEYLHATTTIDIFDGFHAPKAWSTENALLHHPTPAATR